MEHPWLDSLSEDWVSQPRSDDSAAQINPQQQSDSENRKASNVKGSGLGSRIPRPFGGAPGTNDNSISVLAERSLSYINSTAPRRDQPNGPKEPPRPQKGKNRHVSRSVSGATVGSVVHNTVQQRSPSASPPKGKGFTPEWKRRLVYGEIAYGEQRDLFSSAAADGLEGIFKPPPPPPPPQDVTDPEDPFIEGDSNQNETTLPSSPPVFRPPPRFEDTELHEDIYDVDHADVSPSPSPRGHYKEIHYHLNESARSAHDFSIHKDNSQLDNGTAEEEPPPPKEEGPRNALQPLEGEVRKASGQSVVNNEDFSPIYLSRHDSGDGRVDFAPMELPADQLRARLERLHANQMLLDSNLDHGALNPQANSQAAATDVDSTEEYMRNGGFLNLQRGGRSAEGSFRHRLLSPTLGNDSSEMFPDQSLQASTPKQFPTVRNGLGGPGRMIDRSPPIPRAPHPSPEKQRTAPQSSGGSPLKLFGPYDTFTNQTLMRRISQFEEQMTNSEKSFTTNPFRSSPVGTTTRPSGTSQQNVPKPVSVSRFGDGDLDDYEFSGDISRLSIADSRVERGGDVSQQENIPPGSPPAHDSSAPDSSQLVIQRRRQKSSGVLPSSQQSRLVSGTGLNTSEVRANGYLGTPKRDGGSEGKRPRTSPSKDPTPKRRRTLHKTDIAYGLEHGPVDVGTVQRTHQHMQAALGKKKDPRPKDKQHVADPDVPAHRHILRPRTPTANQQSSIQRETVPPYGDAPEESKQKRSPPRKAQPSAGKQTSASEETHRKPSIKTEDFLDEAAQIMAMIRNQVRPTNLASVQESDEQAYGGDHGEDDSYEEPFSRPPSRDGAPVTRIPARQEDPEILQQLMKYKEMSEMGDVITSSLRSVSLAKEAVRATQEMERKLRESTRTNLVGTGEEEFSDPPNIRISQGNTESGATTGTTGTAFPSTSSGGSTNHTTSSRTSECKRTIAPQSVSHLIPDQVGSMYFDREQNRWVKKKSGSGRAHEGVFESEDDPFGSIPDLSVDMTMEMRNLKTATEQTKQQRTAEDPENMPSPSSPPKTPGGQGAGFANLSPSQDAEDAVSRAKDEISKLESKAATSPVREEEVEREISINEGRKRTPSKRRNLTISFSSPVASIIRDVLPEDLEDVAEDEDYTPELPETHDAAKESGALPKAAQANGLRGSRGFSRQTSGRVSFVPRPVSRIDEQDEDSTGKNDEAQDRQVSVVGENSLVSHATPDPRRTSLSFIIKRQADPEGDSSALIGQNVGNLSLSPLSEFTMHNPDQSYGLEVSYVLGNRHLATGDGSKKVNSIALRELVDRLTEAEPQEPYWDGLTALDLRDKRLTSLHMLDEFCGSLVSLDASSNALTHLDGVPSGVRQLKVCGNMLSELTAWDHLVNLQYVDVSNNDVRSLSALRNLVHLRSIRADNNLLTSLDGIDELDGLLSLRARNNEIEELDFEGSGLQRLSELDLGGNRISAVRNIEELSSLSTLKLQRNRLETFGCERSFEALRYLDLSDNSLDTLDLSHMPKLRLLHADRNNLTTLSGLSHARHLDSLSLREQRGHTPLDVALVLSTAYEVRKLFLSGNYVDAFAPQIDLLNLQLLELASCGLRALPAGMGQMMPNLRSLNVCFNAISSLEPLRFVPRLKRLLAAGNRLSDGTSALGVAAGFPHLRELDLRDNPLTLGFYPPGQVLVRADESAAQSVEGFRLPAADRERDASFRRRLDEGTGLRRRLYEVAVAGGCKGLRVLDGLEVRKREVLGRDEVFERLVREGVIPDEEAPGNTQREEAPGNGKEREAAGGRAQGEGGEGDGDSTRWPAEDSFA
ncbi:hypothetical protein VUR80DRAFT_4838 [Thermomyces stellatus]